MERGGRSVDGWFVQWTAGQRVNPGRIRHPTDLVLQNVKSTGRG